MPSSPSFINCLECKALVKLKTKRDFKRKKFCSKSCANKYTSFHRKPKTYKCEECGEEFKCKVATAKRCETCRNNMSLQVVRSYEMLNNNPEKYFQHALYKKGRENLTVKFMLNLFENQNGLCAITKQPLTFIKIHGNGKVQTNASIDRIDPSKGYTKDNVQIVCDIVNVMKLDMDMEELKFWCEAIINGT